MAGVKKGQDLGGVRDFEDLRLRSVIDELTGCWIFQAARKQSTGIIYCPALGKVLSLSALVSVLKTGSLPAKGTIWAPNCGDRACGNPAHRKLMKWAAYCQLRSKPLPVLQRALIARTRRSRGLSRYTPELRAEILSSSETNVALAGRTGLTPQAISKIRHGRMWRDEAQNASVFTWRPAA
jgi:hypothetical protein